MLHSGPPFGTIKSQTFRTLRAAGRTHVGIVVLIFIYAGNIVVCRDGNGGHGPEGRKGAIENLQVRSLRRYYTTSIC